MVNNFSFKLIHCTIQPFQFSLIVWNRLILTTDLKGCLELKKNWLAKEDLPGFEAETTDFILCQLNIFTRS